MTIEQTTGRLLVLLLIGVLAGCASSRDRTEERSAPDTVEADDLEGRYIARVEEMLRGQVAGVEVHNSPSGLIIRIRGASSVYADSDPLFVIDGLPIQLGASGALTGINPQDIESIRVLKNASDTAAYGVRGANGVVLITTKRPPPPPGVQG
ncbi:MAG: TonB-dependent receptor plug domain-containing protein [Rhodothermales bacterium]|nr:TonB-dependent receptor plug domain-containing protein [Rhodothermales bacterium]